MIDERQHGTAKLGDLGPRMAGLQGPALLCFDDAVFQEENFEGLFRFGVGSSGDPTQTGRFGLGFNATYHVTEALVLSRAAAARARPAAAAPAGVASNPNVPPGLMVAFAEEAGSGALDDVFECFASGADVFDCDPRTQRSYPGTLFRFPLRTPEQAEASELRRDATAVEAVKDMLQAFAADGSETALFLQHVSQIEIWHWPKKQANTSNASSRSSLVIAIVGRRWVGRRWCGPCAWSPRWRQRRGGAAAATVCTAGRGSSSTDGPHATGASTGGTRGPIDRAAPGLGEEEQGAGAVGGRRWLSPSRSGAADLRRHRAPPYASASPPPCTQSLRKPFANKAVVLLMLVVPPLLLLPLLHRRPCRPSGGSSLRSPRGARSRRSGGCGRGAGRARAGKWRPLARRSAPTTRSGPLSPSQHASGAS